MKPRRWRHAGSGATHGAHAATTVPAGGFIGDVNSRCDGRLLDAIDGVRRMGRVVRIMRLKHFRDMHRIVMPATKDHSCRREPLQWDRKQQQTENDRFQRWHARFLDAGKR